MICLGLIAEDKSDIGVMRQIAGKILPEGSFGTKHFVGEGCGKLKRKCRAWAEQLLRRGCSHIIVVHDLDDEAEKGLRKLLEDTIKGVRREGCTNSDPGIRDRSVAPIRQPSNQEGVQPSKGTQSTREPGVYSRSEGGARRTRMESREEAILQLCPQRTDRSGCPINET